MNRTSFGTVAASLSPKTNEGALILDRATAQHLRQHIQWMRQDPTFIDITTALKWVEEQTQE